MNKFIKAQLEKCKVAIIPEYDDNTTNMVIPMKSTNIFGVDYSKSQTNDINFNSNNLNERG